MLDERILLSIQDLFVFIRSFCHFYNGSGKKEIPEPNPDLISEKKALVAYFGEGFEKEILLYAISSLQTFLMSEQYSIAEDFADAVHNLPELFLMPYVPKQYWRVFIEPFREKYGEQYFKTYQREFGKQLFVVCKKSRTKRQKFSKWLL